ncbi:MAG: BPSS1780 family membrane protein [Candidatus Competibacteraceae bacterium]
MTAIQVDAGQGWNWIVEGWRLFIKAPGMWIVMLLIYLGINIVLSFIPLVGALATTLIAPALVGGMLYGAASLDRGEDLAIPHLFRAFQDQERLGPMLTLGALLLACYIVVGLIVAGVLFGGMIGGGALSGNLSEEQLVGLALGAGLIFALIVLVVSLLIAMALFYAIPLVMLGGQSPWSAVQSSFSACLTNWLPLLVFGLVYLVLAILAVIPIGLGFLVLMPVTFAAIYVSYRDVFPEPDAGHAPSLTKY